jgi:hypothetical protein
MRIKKESGGYAMCYDCVHKINIPGNCHIGCNNLNARPKVRTWPECGLWPLNYDPATVVSCEGYSNNPQDKKPVNDDPLIEFLRILAGAGRL